MTIRHLIAELRRPEHLTIPDIARAHNVGADLVRRALQKLRHDFRLVEEVDAATETWEAVPKAVDRFEQSPDGLSWNESLEEYVDSNHLPSEGGG